MLIYLIKNKEETCTQLKVGEMYSCVHAPAASSLPIKPITQSDHNTPSPMLTQVFYPNMHPPLFINPSLESTLAVPTLETGKLSAVVPNLVNPSSVLSKKEPVARLRAQHAAAIHTALEARLEDSLIARSHLRRYLGHSHAHYARILSVPHAT